MSVPVQDMSVPVQDTSQVAKHLGTFFAAWMQTDAKVVVACYSPDCVMDDPTLEAPLRGWSAVEAYYRQMFANLEAPRHDLVDYASRDNRVWFQWTFVSGGIEQPKLEHRGVSIHTLGADGLITLDQAFWHPGRANDGVGRSRRPVDP
jgi:hypothetical protein